MTTRGNSSVPSALVIVDVQRLLVDALETSRRKRFLATLSDLRDRARTAGVPVVYIRHQDEEFVPGTAAWHIAPEIAPGEGEPIVEKRFRDSFRETDLEDVLKRLGVEQLVVCGMQTEFCVDATAREAERRGYRVTLVEDGSATYAAGGLSEDQIREHVHRVARGKVAHIAPASALFSDL
jgi:nicotinamidase-related amidase